MARWLLVLAMAGLATTPSESAGQADTSTAEGATIPLARQFRARLLSLPTDSVKYLVGGRVVSSVDGRPVAGAEVYLGDRAVETRTDRAGHFRLDGSSPGRVELWVDGAHHARGCVYVDLSADRMLSLLISLPPDEPLSDGGIRTGIWRCRDPETVEPPGP